MTTTEAPKFWRPPVVRPPTVSKDAFSRVFRVPPEQAGMRLDVFLSSVLRNTSRTRAKLIAEKGVFSVNGSKLRASDRLRGETFIVVWRSPIDEAEGPLELPVVYEDEHLLVIDKPPLLTVHPTARYHNVTVIKILGAQRPDEPLSLIHRLDRETSGILLVARTREADRAFKRLLEDKSVAAAGGCADPTLMKTYLAITWGVPKDGLIDLPMDHDTDNPLRVKMKVVRPGAGLEARTEVRVLERTEAYALVACRLLTGRQHQIRVHLAAVGCPVVGDKLYGPDDRMLARAADGELTDDDLARLELPHHALHAHRYQLRHAITGAALDLVAPLPDTLASFWEQKRGIVGPSVDGPSAVR
jgi:23S rRNA pseudouridine1911/1915/1917 synthase